MRKSFSTLLITFSIIFFLNACNINSDTENEVQGDQDNNLYILSLGHVGTQAHSWHTTLLEFAETVEKESDGQLKIEVFPDGQLGGNLEMLQQIQMGELDMGVIGGAVHSPIVPEMAIENLPFVFETHEEAYQAMDGELGNKLLELLEQQGITGLAWWEDGMFQITNNSHPIEKPEDLKGLKIRVPEIELRQEAFKALGANPVPMSFDELFSALQQGVVDGQTNPAEVVLTSNFNEVQDYLSIINISWSSALMEINSDVWDNLPEHLQEIIQENAIKYRDIQRSRIRERNEEVIKELESLGMKVNIVEDLTPFVEAVESVYEKYSDEFGEDLMNLIVK